MRSLVARNVVIWCAILLLAGMSVACNQGDDDGTSKDESGETVDNGEGKSDETSDNGDSDSDSDEEEAIPVEAVALAHGRIESVLSFSTNLEAEGEVQVFSEAARRIQKLLVEEGDKVRKGQVLVSLQDEAQRTALARAESQVAKARREYNRQTELHEQQLISEQLYTEATYDLEQLDLALEDAKRELGYTEVRAPISGTITQRLVNVGDQVTVNQHLFDIVDFDSIIARIYVPEKELLRVSKGLNARIFSSAVGGEPHFGTVDRIAPRVDPRSGTVKVTVSIPRSEALLPGMYVSVELVSEVHDDALLVPKKALIYDADQVYVFRIKEESRVERLLVRAALEDRDNIEPVAGLEPGDRIVVAGQAGLKDESLVRVVGEGADEVAEPSDAAEDEETAS